MARADAAVSPLRRVRDVTAALLQGYPLGAASPHADKEERGRVLVIGGGRGTSGAVRLAGEAALRAGAGKLQLATARSASLALAVAVPEALILEWPETRDGGLRVGASRELRTRCAQADAVLVGPGMLDGEGAARLVGRLAFGSAATLVLDAGAIDACAVRARCFPAGTVITPHAGELKRVAQRLGIDAEQLPHTLASSVAVRCGVVCVAKGATTWIATPDGTVFRHECAIPGLGTSGSGDVLAGMLAGLAARSGKPLNAALWAVHLHATAGRKLQERVGRLGFLARELAPEIPPVLPS